MLNLAGTLDSHFHKGLKYRLTARVCSSTVPFTSKSYDHFSVFHGDLMFLSDDRNMYPAVLSCLGNV